MLGGNTISVIVTGVTVLSVVLLPEGSTRRKEDESLDALMRRFRFACQRAGTLKEVKRHTFYQPEAERRRLRVRAAKRKAMIARKFAEPM